MFVYFLIVLTTYITVVYPDCNMQILEIVSNKANEAPSRWQEAKNDRRTVEALQFMSKQTKTSSCETSPESKTGEKVSGAMRKVVVCLRVSSKETLPPFSNVLFTLWVTGSLSNEDRFYINGHFILVTHDTIWPDVQFGSADSKDWGTYLFFTLL